MAEAFLIYESFVKAAKRMTNDQKAELFDAMCAMGIDEDYDVIDRIEDPVVAMVMEVIRPQIEANARRRDGGQKGGRPKTRGFEDEKPMVMETQNHRFSESETTGYETPKPNENEKENENDNDKEKENEKGSLRGKRFAPPTLSEVTDYCNQRANGIDPQGFIDYYEQSGWKLSNGQKMVDWKAAVRNWESRRKQERRQATPTKPNPFTDYTHQTTYDWDAIEAYETANPVLKNYAGS